MLPGGHVRGDVIAARVRVDGLLEGRVRATRQVFVGPRGRLLAEVHGVLLVDEGGSFRGRLHGEIGPLDPPSLTHLIALPPSAPTPVPEPGRPRRALVVPPPFALEIVDDVPPAAPSTASLPAVSEEAMAQSRARQAAVASNELVVASDSEPPARLSRPAVHRPTPRMPPPFVDGGAPVAPQRTATPGSPVPRPTQAPSGEPPPDRGRRTTQPSARRPVAAQAPPRSGSPPRPQGRPLPKQPPTGRQAAAVPTRRGDTDLDDPWFDEDQKT